MRARGWEDYDFLYVCGDAYVDHPSFGAAILSRVLEAYGYRVCLLCQPKMTGGRMEMPVPRPRLAALVSAGNVDSMVAHYTAARRRRSEDWYSPGKKAGLRPDRAVTVYTRELRRLFGDLPIVIGGIEASLRRFAHYDYWDDALRPSILIESGADLLSYGMGERSLTEIAALLDRGVPVGRITGVRGTCYAADSFPDGIEAVECAPMEKCRLDTEAGRFEYAKACRLQYREHDHTSVRAVVQRHGDRWLVQNPPALPLTTPELDWVYSLPYCRAWHPRYAAAGGVPALDEVKFSITHVRGCFGNCSFCSIAFHQGRFIRTRSDESVLAEARLLTTLPDFKGYLHDVGGPTANFRRPSCDGQETRGLCRDKSCLAPKPCPNLKADQSAYLALLDKLRALPGVKKVFIRSGIRFDYLMQDPDDGFFRALVRHHVSGQLKVAPEHCAAQVLGYMNKPDFSVFEAFKAKYEAENRRIGKEQYLVPYLMSSHPGSDLVSAIALAQYLRRERLNPEQVQDFYPTPGTFSTCMFATGLDPRTLKPVFVPRTDREKAWQRALLQSRRPENHALVREALIRAGRQDLIGSGPTCLVPAEGRTGPAKRTDKRPGPGRPKRGEGSRGRRG
ncbi:MAG: YgiQ family radical SAM protein [Oscillospiraceae bacterium]|nr:YgiQ family radical SAM protein [Oscillospiraceae bacterium]